MSAKKPRSTGAAKTTAHRTTSNETPAAKRKTRAKIPEILAPEPDNEELETSSSEDIDFSDDDSVIEAEATHSHGEEDLRPHSDESDHALPTIATQSEAVSISDPLKRYLEEIRNTPLLSVEEELELAKKLREEGDLNAAKRLVSANLRLVVRIAFEYKTIYSNMMDLIQEGNIGLMKAVSKYDPTKGARLSYYATWWIRSYILKYILDNFRLIKIGTTQAQKKLFYHLIREKERLEAQGIAAVPKLLADRLNVKEKEVVEMQSRLSGSGQEFSLDQPIDSSAEKKSYWIDQVQDAQESPDASLETNELIQILESKIPDFETHLTEKEKHVFRDRLLAEEPKTLQEIADRYGLTRERARQIEAKVIEKLRQAMHDAIGDFNATEQSK